MISNDNKMLGQILVASGKLDPDDLDMALREHHKTGERVGAVLTKMGLVTEEDVLDALAQQLNLSYVRLSDITIPEDVISSVKAKLVTHYNFVPVEKTPNMLKVAVMDPLNIHLLDDLRLILKTEIEPVVASSKEIKDAIKKYYGLAAETVEQLMDEEEKTRTLEMETPEIEDIENMAEDASIVRFVNQIIAEAFADRATDIHIEPMENELRIRYRIDGVLYEASIPPSIKNFQSAIISRVKIMADMNIAEHRLPQDGKIKIKMGKQDFDLRVSSIPTPYGESIGIRILTRDSELCRLDRLGFDEQHQEVLRDMINKPHGIILVSGPTGSGKSTTLYAALTEINTTDKKIITIEDPIEYRIRGASQIQVQSDIGLTFARSLRTILRHDPDVIMVGEIRDQETAQITIRTALTGHLVFSTIHTNDACSAVARLLDMEIEPFLISSSVVGILAQRLVRVLCPECKTPYTPPEELISQINMLREDYSNVTFYRSVGCEKCRYTGFRGRTAIYEIVKMNDDLRDLITDRAPANVLRKSAIKHGMRPLRLDGWKKVKQGITTIEEVLRVTLEDEFLIDHYNFLTEVKKDEQERVVQE